MFLPEIILFAIKFVNRADGYMVSFWKDNLLILLCNIYTLINQKKG